MVDDTLTIRTNQAVKRFRRWDKTKSADPRLVDELFEQFGPGNVLERPQNPFKRFQDYEHLLEALCDEDKGKYRVIHKGTPFYFLAWLSYDMGNYEKGLFYLDATISEDIRKDAAGWQKGSAGMFLFLQTPEKHPARRIAEHLRSSIQSRLDDFNSISGAPPLSLDNFVKQFVEPLVAPEAATRSIVTAFYSFILEFQDLIKLLELRGSAQGSVEPFVTHLFKGGLIFESILKRFYSASPGDKFNTIGQIFNSNKFEKDFPPGKFKTSAKSITDIVIGIKARCDYETAFTTTAKLRNTTGHKLDWDDKFSNSYESLFKQEVNAIFYVIQNNL